MISIINKTRHYIEKNKAKKFLRSILKLCDAAYGRRHGDINLLFCDREFIRKLNLQYRKKNAPTDVLSFNLSGDDEKISGDIALNIEVTLENGLDSRSHADMVIAETIVHGLMHLYGETHSYSRSEYQRLHGKQIKMLEKINVPCDFVKAV
ncbi:MAG: rRNA maturation RNase YbeY [Spirochaetes bacterium GWF1_41_5]|nr:MAG: rRNA maturation RNase YbeY [Spirochaetes bacterium GWF1_41_5]HBE01083.1 rRNA maturation RNase YbeY [Spirochaetia bacterium]